MVGGGEVFGNDAGEQVDELDFLCVVVVDVKRIAADLLHRRIPRMHALLRSHLIRRLIRMLRPRHKTESKRYVLTRLLIRFFKHRMAHNGLTPLTKAVGLGGEGGEGY